MEWVIFDTVSGTRMQAQSGWDNLIELVTNPPKSANKKSCKLLKLCSFGSCRTPKKSLRHDANVLSVTGVEGDYDGGVMQINQAEKILSVFGIEAILHTTPSHSKDRPRWRVLAPLSKSYNPGERVRFITILDALLGGVLARESFTLTQTFFFGAVDGVDYDVRRVRGRCIDEMEK